VDEPLECACQQTLSMGEKDFDDYGFQEMTYEPRCACRQTSSMAEKDFEDYDFQEITYEPRRSKRAIEDLKEDYDDMVYDLEGATKNSLVPDEDHDDDEVEDDHDSSLLEYAFEIPNDDLVHRLRELEMPYERTEEVTDSFFNPVDMKILRQLIRGEDEVGKAKFKDMLKQVRRFYVGKNDPKFVSKVYELFTGLEPNSEDKPEVLTQTFIDGVVTYEN